MSTQIEVKGPKIQIDESFTNPSSFFNIYPDPERIVEILSYAGIRSSEIDQITINLEDKRVQKGENHATVGTWNSNERIIRIFPQIHIEKLDRLMSIASYAHVNRLFQSGEVSNKSEYPNTAGLLTNILEDITEDARLRRILLTDDPEDVIPNVFNILVAATQRDLNQTFAHEAKHAANAIQPFTNSLMEIGYLGNLLGLNYLRKKGVIAEDQVEALAYRFSPNERSARKFERELEWSLDHNPAFLLVPNQIPVGYITDQTSGDLKTRLIFEPANN